MNQMALVRNGTYADCYQITVSGVVYGYDVRHDGGEVTNVHAVRNDGRGGLKSGSKKHQEVLAAIALSKVSP